MQEFVGQLHANKQKWVPIVDPGIKMDPGYPAYDKGILAKAFVTDFTGEPYLGQVGIAVSSWCKHPRKHLSSCCACWTQATALLFSMLN